VMVASALFPVLAFAFAFAEDLIAFVYTEAYVEGAAAMRVYIAGMAALVVEVGSVVLLLRQGAFAMRLGALCLVVSVAVSWLGASHVGLAGAAAGSVLAVYLDRVVMLRRISRMTGLSVRRMQEWGWLSGSLVLAAAAAGAAWTAAGQLDEQQAFPRLLLGSAVVALVYGVPAWWVRRK
jgi:O-antigen/teichoic acid export membrane protein